MSTIANKNLSYCAVGGRGVVSSGRSGAEGKSWCVRCSPAHKISQLVGGVGLESGRLPAPSGS